MATAEEPDTSPTQRQSRHSERSADLRTLTATNHDFAISLFGSLREGAGDDNIFFSPFSIYRSLAMLYAGASDQTRTELERALNFGLEDESLHRTFNTLTNQLSPQSSIIPNSNSENFELHIVSRFWGQMDYPFHNSYLNLLTRYYDTTLRQVDFQTNANTILKEINQWVR